MAVGILIMALLPITAAVAAAAATPDEIPIAITQPIGHFAVGTPGLVVPETVMMMIVGTGLLGMGAIVRRSTRQVKESGIGNQVSGLD